MNKSSDTQQQDPEIFIGREIQNYMTRGHYSAATLASRLYCDRTNIYKIFTKDSIDTNTLFKISVYLRHNFFSIYTRAYESMKRSKDNDGQHMT